MENLNIETTQAVNLEYKIASIGDRLIAFFIDFFFLVMVWVIVFYLTYKIFTFNDSALFYTNLFMFFVFFTYHFWCEILFNGQSIGKRIKNIKVVMMDGTSPSLGNYLLRWLLRLVDISLTNGLAALISVVVSKNSQRLGDLAAGTTVIKLDQKISIEDTIFKEVQEEYQVKYKEAEKLSDSDIEIMQELLKLNKGRDVNEKVIEASYRAKDKLESKLGIKSQQTPTHFFSTLITDYNKLNGVV